MNAAVTPVVGPDAAASSAGAGARAAASADGGRSARQDPPGAAACGAIVLVAISHPALGDIRIDDTLFAIGRNETPFDGYPDDTVADLSRRHARIFSEAGLVHVADMGSKNGTLVNDIDIRQKTARLQDGDELRFGRQLCYRVRLPARPPQPPLKLASLTLTPAKERDAGAAPDGAPLEQIVVRTFPFLVSKTDATFARYRQQNPQQVNYLSRRHAHVFLRRGLPFVEDLGSTNGTFVNGQRLAEQAVALNDGDTVAFGGRYFVYGVRLEQEAPQLDPTLTRYAGLTPAAAQAGDHAMRSTGPAGAARASAVAGAAGEEGAMGAARAAGAAPVAGAAGRPEAAATHGLADRQASAQPERTTFIVAADSFLDIFCIDPPPVASARIVPAGERAGAAAAGGHVSGRMSGQAAGVEAAAHAAAGERSAPAPRRGIRALLPAVPAWLATAITPALRRRLRRRAWIGAALCACLALAGGAWYAAGAPQREMQALMAAGQYREAAALSAARLRADPEQASLRSLATDAWLKAFLPAWIAAVRARDAPGVDAALAALQTHAAGNPAAAALLDELALIGWLERTVAPQAGTSTPIRLFADEARIAALLAKWETDPAGHQLRAAEIGASVPAFQAVFASALSDLRRLQSDSAVTLAAIARLKTGVDEALAQGRPEEIPGLIDAAAEKAPQLAGLDALREDARRYLALEQVRRDGNPEALRQAMQAMQTPQGGFATPPFRLRQAALARGGQSPVP